MEPREPQGHKAKEAHRVILALKEPQVLKGHKATEDHKVLKEPLGHKEP